MHFVMHAFSSYVKVLHDVTPIDLLAQSAVLFLVNERVPNNAAL